MIALSYQTASWLERLLDVERRENFDSFHKLLPRACCPTIRRRRRNRIRLENTSPATSRLISLSTGPLNRGIGLRGDSAIITAICGGATIFIKKILSAISTSQLRGASEATPQRDEDWSNNPQMEQMDAD
jgi:hypothetical protein